MMDLLKIASYKYKKHGEYLLCQVINKVVLKDKILAIKTQPS